jgi:hypothetical protein|tara:strand:- start:5717 stop:6337 length:621 start_codon:yes stop_codon:yes gene_type:complete
MYRKIFFQFILLTILIFTLWYIFYFYLREDSRFIELQNNNSLENNNINLTSKEKEEVNKQDDNKEITENLVYKSKDAKGNTYLLKAKFGETNREDKNTILLNQVTGTINLIDRPLISIKADHAEYNYENLNTKFFDDVKIKYSSNIIKSDNLDLIFNENIANMYNNVFFKNNSSSAKADLINFDLLTGNIIIKMNEKNKKIVINKK